MKLVNAKTAVIVIIIALILLLMMNIGILTGLFPYSMVWGGNIDSSSEMIEMELITIFVILLFLVITFLKLRNLGSDRNQKIINFGLWLMFAYFTLNIVGNLAAENISGNIDLYTGFNRPFIIFSTAGPGEIIYSRLFSRALLGCIRFF